jgi:hypothetical protein
MDRYIARVDRVLADSELTVCCYETPESTPGACDAILRDSRATVHQFATALWRNYVWCKTPFLNARLFVFTHGIGAEYLKT